ncbi:MAG: hypothetical protein KJ734_03730, partial [Chloroflexi bacterium]|nr:hypothetical protein [Chloroflexota bacterium]
LPDGKVLVVGGLYVDGDYHYLASAEVYAPGTGTWSAAGSLATGRAQHTATLLTSGKVLVVGGSDGGYNSLQSVEVYDPATGWSTTGSLVTGRSRHTATLLPNGRVLVAGGNNTTSGGSPLSSAEIYNPTPGTWSATGSLGAVRARHTATLLPDGRLLAVGGVGSGYLASAEIYQPAAGAWSAVASLNTARRDHATALLHNGQALVAGGHDGSNYLASAESYKQSTNTWVPIGDMNDARARHTMTLMPDGRLMVVGGYNGSYLASAEILSPTTATWSATGSLGGARADHTATLLADGRLLVVGGTNASGRTSSAEIYDPATRTWEKTGTLHAVRSGHTATLLYDGRVLVIGGYSAGPNPVATAEVYDPATESWSVTGSMSDARVWHTATLLYDSRVLVVGGLGSGTTYLSSAELYNPGPGTGTWSATGSLNSARDHHAAALLPNSQVLVAGGFFWDGADHWQASTEIYDPGTETWELVNGLHSPRANYTLTLLPDGRLLAAGGYDSSFMTSAEVYDRGLGFAEGWRPTLTTATSPLYQGQQLQVSGSGYRGFLYTDAASGGTSSSPTNYPLVQLRRLDNERILWLHPDPVSSFSATAFTSVPVVGFPQGPALVTVFVNGIPSTSKVIQVLEGYRIYLPLTLKNY